MRAGLYGSVASPAVRWAAKLREKLRAGSLGSQFSVADVYLRGWAGLETAESARAALGVLEDAGWVRRDRQAGKEPAGARRKAYVVHPGIYAG
jgi:hypothetical protein